ncbi:MAG: 30S ribosomal protein S6 [Candidatus Cloacimonetes bacterium]|jgi:small subunit ribosomal protein S6|nr:30S ribosomal protein S6 [Candidatus Cloacimonadota bacterium]MBT4334032.1 30S ribosomal protein S6 [Candidatus Cloacimonadota bacterium]MBT4574863.1 30S ribosomal protein S6 [Candidatus Cloacimonadota bacterium]MBT5420096.1 30S ribosomal protein S6 [Candidatus Cloacimonadota bacterium]
MLNKYESMVVIAPTISEENAKKENESIKDFIKENGGEVIKTDEWGKKRLAYQINKFKEGYYFINYFTLDVTKVNELDRFYKLNEYVIRNNILTK